MIQRSPEWFEARKGRITASLVGAILGLNPYMTRADAMRVMVREALGAEREFTGNVATQWGVNNEDGALIDFRFKTELDVQKAGFIIYEDWAGCSPDGLIGANAGVEVKCPYGLRTSHCPVPFKTLAEQPHYEAQVQFSMFITGRDEWHFFQWTPRETKNEVVARSQDWIDRYVPVLRQFHAEYLWELENNSAEHLAPKRASIDTPEAQAMIDEWPPLSLRKNASARCLMTW
jgi:putative phage-type endonuclease